MANKTNETIEYIDERRLLNGLSPVMREPVLAPYKTASELSEALKSFETEKDLDLLFLHVCENGTVEDFEKLKDAVDFDFGEAKNYRALVTVCIEQKFIERKEATFEP